MILMYIHIAIHISILHTILFSSDETDYVATAGFNALLMFNNENRRSCANIQITDDTVYENQERFTLRLGDLGGSFALPNNLVRSPNMSEIIILDNESE